MQPPTTYDGYSKKTASLGCDSFGKKKKRQPSSSEQQKHTKISHVMKIEACVQFRAQFWAQFWARVLQ